MKRRQNIKLFLISLAIASFLIFLGYLFAIKEATDLQDLFFGALIAILASLLMSFFITRQSRKRIMIAGFVISGLLIVSGIYFFSVKNRVVCSAEEIERDHDLKIYHSKIIITGTKLLSQYAGIPELDSINSSSSKCTLFQKLTTFNPEEIWEPASINSAKKELNRTYISTVILLIMLFITIAGRIFQDPVEDPGNKVSTVKPAYQVPEIFFSYAWGEEREKIVDLVYDSLKKLTAIRVIRDKVDLDYKGLISEFMIRIGKGNFVVVAISDKYLKSIYCMFELYEVYRNGRLEKKELIEKIYPIRVESIDFSAPATIEIYFNYWRNKKEEWKNFVENQADMISQEQQADYDRVKKIAGALGELLGILDDINSSTLELISANNFEKIKDAINKKIIELNDTGTSSDIR